MKFAGEPALNFGMQRSRMQPAQVEYHDDKTMAMIEARAKQIFQSSVVAHEGMEIVLR